MILDREVGTGKGTSIGEWLRLFVCRKSCFFPSTIRTDCVWTLNYHGVEEFVGKDSGCWVM